MVTSFSLISMHQFFPRVITESHLFCFLYPLAEGKSICPNRVTLVLYQPLQAGIIFRNSWSTYNGCHSLFGVFLFGYSLWVSFGEEDYFVFLVLGGIVVVLGIFLFWKKLKFGWIRRGRGSGRTWEEGKNMINIYLDLKIALNKK